MAIENITDTGDLMGYLRDATVGFLGLVDGDGPYVVPVNFAVVDGEIVIHCAFKGRKIDAAKNGRSATFVVATTHHVPKDHRGGHCNPPWESVMAFGPVREVEDVDLRLKLLNAFLRRHDTDAKPITREDAEKCNVLAMRIERITGRRQLEAVPEEAK